MNTTLKSKDTKEIDMKKYFHADVEGGETYPSQHERIAEVTGDWETAGFAGKDKVDEDDLPGDYSKWIEYDRYATPDAQVRVLSRYGD